LRLFVSFGGQTQENPDIHCATASNEQLHIVRKTLGMYTACDFHSSKVLDRCMI
jgi:hypothetical protein